MPVTLTNIASLQYGEELPGYFACAVTEDTGAGFGANAVSNSLDSELGVDIDCVTDIDPMLTLATGWRNLANALCRRLLTTTGFLYDVTGDVEESANYGEDIRAKLNSAFTDDDARTLEARIQAQMLADERVDSADVSVVFVFETSSLTITIDLETRAGPFSLIMNVSELTVEILDGKGTQLV